jgi:hypothetical protein
MKLILFNLFTITIIIFSWGCNQKETNIESKFENWNYLSWYTGAQEFTIFNYTDSIRLETRHYKQNPSKRNGMQIDWILDSTTTEYAKINNSERDSIFKWTKKLIYEPVMPKVFMTDYVGRLYVMISISDQVSQSCKYNSIGNWAKLSRETTEMNKILCKKFKIVEKIDDL